MTTELRFHGCMPANLLPFTADLEIDEAAYRKHLRWLADTAGVTGIVANGHAAEVSSLDRDERRRALAIALDEIAGKVPVVAGVYADGTKEAVALARDARAEGAAGLLVFPPTLFMWGAQMKPDMALRHFSTLADAVDEPLIVFEYPPASGIGYDPETLGELCKIPTVAAVKDWSNDIVAYERNLRAIRGSGRPVAMLSSFTMSLMATFVLGADGCISGMGSVAADLQAKLLAAVKTRDLGQADRLNERLAPLVNVFYAPPFVDMHNRMKEALVMLGRIPAAHVRPPLTPISDEERHRLRLALRASALQ
jgi:4-hydroxy-tetrahydrodipicolinate synthase